MGGGTAGWVSSLYFLNKSNRLGLNLKIKLISSNKIEVIGVGEGTTIRFKDFIERDCGIDRVDFLKNTKGSFKYGIKFDNWNFDNEFYYHFFDFYTRYESANDNINYDFCQYCINNDLNVNQKTLQKSLNGFLFDLVENNKISINLSGAYAYHFSAALVVDFLREKCLEYKNFEHISDTIQSISLDESGGIKELILEENNILSGDFFVNCLGFNSTNILPKHFFDIEDWGDKIINNAAFAIQVKNHPLETLEPYTTSTAQEYGWTWKIPQYEKTGYGYVYSSDFVDDEDKLYQDILKTYKIKEKNVFKTRTVKSKAYYNKKQLHQNVLSLGLSSGFVEPLEATSIHMTLISLDVFFEMVENGYSSKELEYNATMHKLWTNVFKFIIYHYFTKNPINDYWKHYAEIESDNKFEFYEKYFDIDRTIFSRSSYFSISLGMKKKDLYYDFGRERFLEENIKDFLKIEKNLNTNGLWSQNEVLNDIHKNLKSSYKYH